MKINVYQKIVLALYGMLFIYFSIIHVPFKTGKYNNEIEYDTLFSNRSNLDISRLVIIVLTLTVLGAVVFLLLKNISLKVTVKPFSKKLLKPIIYILASTVLILTTVFIINKYQNKKKILDTPETSDSVEIKPIKEPANSGPSLRDIKKAETCNENQALTDFKAYMKFYYPDWKIYGKAILKESSDCTYEIQFTTMDPHIRYEKEVMIVEISYSYDYNRYNFRRIRGTLY